MDMIKFSTFPAEGNAGAAAAQGFSPMVSGLIYKVVVAFEGGAPLTTRTTLTDVNDPAAENVVDLTNVNSLTTLYPRRAQTTSTGSATTYNGTQWVPTPFPAHGPLRLTISQSDPGSIATVTVYLIKG